MERSRVESIIKEVRDKVLRWRDYADEGGVFTRWRDQIQKTLRLRNIL